jgi:HK97 family phage portal protein
MGLLQRIQRSFGELRGNPLDNPSMSLTSPGIWAWLTGGEPTAAGELVNETNALQIVTVYACVRVLAESVASLPLKLYERLDNGRQEATDQDLYELLTISPNPEMTAFSFFETLVGSLALCGNAYAQIQRSGSTVQGLWPLHPLKTQPVRTPAGKLMFQTSDGMANGASRLIDPDDMLAIPLFSFDGVKGLSPIQMARQDLGLAKAATKFGARFFSNGGRPSGVLSTASVLNPKQHDDMKSSWQSSNGGENQGKTALLWGDWKYQQIGINLEDSQFLATRQFARCDIAALFRVPSHMVGDNTRLSNSNHEQQSLSFVTDTLRPYLNRIEQEVHRKLMPSTGRNAGKYFVSFDVRERLRGDFATTMAGFAVGKQWGFYNTNQILEDLGENPIGARGDDYWMPVNFQVVGAPAATIPTPADRNALGDYAAALGGLFRDGLGRLLAREKRDCGAMESIFRPLLDSLLAVAKGSAELDPVVCERLVRDALKAFEKRSGDWTPEKADEIAGPEFIRLVRGMVANVGREIGAQTALKQLEGKSDE